MDTELKGFIDTESHVHTVQPTRLLNCVGCWYLVVLGAVGEDEPDVGDELVGRHVARVPRRLGLQPPLHDGEVHGRPIDTEASWVCLVWMWEICDLSCRYSIIYWFIYIGCDSSKTRGTGYTTRVGDWS